MGIVVRNADGQLTTPLRTLRHAKAVLIGVMAQHVRIRIRTLLLIAVIVVLVAQWLSLFVGHNPPNGVSEDRGGLDFLLEVYGEPGGVSFLEGSRPELPLFDPVLTKWTVGNQSLSDFASVIQGLEIGPHGSSPFVVVALPNGSTVGDYRQAIASLSWHGICRVGVYAPQANEEYVSLRNDIEPSKDVSVPVYRVLEVKLGSGASRTCKDRFRAWEPWGEDR